MQDFTKLVLGASLLTVLVLVHSYFTQPLDETEVSSTAKPKEAKGMREILKPHYESVEVVDNVITKRSLVQLIKAVQADMAGRLSALKADFEERCKGADPEALSKLRLRYVRHQEKEQNAALEGVLAMSNISLADFQRSMDRYGTHSEVMAEFSKLQEVAALSHREVDSL
jgi:hypothetical protein